jgi:RNA polymerase sigma factor (sigma-70 family)
MSETAQEESDAGLVRRIAEDRDESALAELMTRYAPKATGYLRRQFQHQLRHPEIDQAINDAAFKLWENAHRYDKTKKFGPWFLTIAHRAALDVLKGERRQPTGDLDFDPPDRDWARREEEHSPRVAWYVEQLEQILDQELQGFEQVVGQADLAAGGPADTQLLMQLHGKTRNVVQATRSKVWRKIRQTVLQREALRNQTKVTQ